MILVYTKNKEMEFSNIRKEYLYLIKYEDLDGWLTICTQDGIDEIQREAMEHVPHLTDEPILTVYQHNKLHYKVGDEFLDKRIMSADELKSILKDFAMTKEEFKRQVLEAVSEKIDKAFEEYGDFDDVKVSDVVFLSRKVGCRTNENKFGINIGLVQRGDVNTNKIALDDIDESATYIGGGTSSSSYDLKEIKEYKG